MPATYTFDIFSTLDGYGSYGPDGDWGGYWGKQGPEFLDHRLALYSEEQRMVLGANTFREFLQMLSPGAEESAADDPLAIRMLNMPTTVVSTTLEGPLDWPDVTVVSGDAVDVVVRLKEESELPLRSHGSLSLNRALMAAGLVDYVQVFSCHHRSDRGGTDLSGCGRLRPRADREPDVRRPHPRAHLSTHTPLIGTDSTRAPSCSVPAATSSARGHPNAITHGIFTSAPRLPVSDPRRLFSARACRPLAVRHDTSSAL